MVHTTIVFVAITLGAYLLYWAIREELFHSYQRQVAAECGVEMVREFRVVPGEARPQEVHAGIVRVGEAWLVRHDVPRKALVMR